MRVLSFVVLLSVSTITIALGQTNELPVKVEINLMGAYEMRFDKKVIEWQYPQYDVEIPGDKAIQRYYAIEILIQNTSTEPIYLWFMSCYWTENFIINNDYMFFSRFKCDEDSLKVVKIMPSDSIRYITELLKHIKFDYPGVRIFEYGVEDTKLGLVVVNDVYQDSYSYKAYQLGMWDKSKWKIAWSNPLQLHQFIDFDTFSKPRPIKIPV